ncbi:MAG: thioredoxin [Ruminococcaceae bacterium]|nr:thioredoxin [Oscillospiraceae bacterium]
MAEIIITKDNFESEVLASNIPVVVDFWATWCGPCKMLAPVLSEYAEENEGSVKVGKVNVDEQGELAIKFGIISIPTLLVFKNGELAGSSVGFCTKEEIEALVNA